MTATLEPRSPIDQWRQRLGGRCRRVQPRSLAAMGYLTDSPVVDGLIEVEKLTFVLLYDDLIRPQQCALRLAGYSGNRIPWGVRFGGRANCRFIKDLMLQPVPGGEGYRMDLANEELLALGLQLDRELQRHARLEQQIRVRPSLPKLWAAFQPDYAPCITGDGPELAAYAARVGKTPESLLQRLRREHAGMMICPLAWVSHHWQQATTIFADLRHFPKRQVIRMQRDSLIGFHDAAEYDLAGRQSRPITHRKPNDKRRSTPHASEPGHVLRNAG